MPLCQVIDLINPSYRSIAHNLDYNLFFYWKQFQKLKQCLKVAISNWWNKTLVSLIKSWKCKKFQNIASWDNIRTLISCHQGYRLRNYIFSTIKLWPVNTIEDSNVNKTNQTSNRTAAPIDKIKDHQLQLKSLLIRMWMRSYLKYACDLLRVSVRCNLDGVLPKWTDMGCEMFVF